MNRTTIHAAAALVAALALTACKKENAIEKLDRADGAVPAADPMKLEVTASPTAKLGDDIVFHVKLTNSGSSEATVNVPRIDRRSLVLRTRLPSGEIATVERIHAALGNDEFLYEPAETKKLGGGESFTTDVPVVAVLSGKLTFTPTYTCQGASSPLVGTPLEVEVAPADPAAPRLGVKFETSHGAYTAVLRPDIAFNNVESFASLVKKGYFTGVKFHRIVAGFMAQGGDPTGTGGGGPGYWIPLEATNPPKLIHKRGVLSMARTGMRRIGRDTAGSQFFLMFTNYPSLDGQYTAFGEMVEGEETLKKLEAVPTAPNAQGEKSTPQEKVLIERASLVQVK